MTRHLVPVSIYLSLLLSCNSPKEYKSFDEYPSYEGDDLELFYSPTKSVFTLWAPTAEEVRLNLYASGEGRGAYPPVADEILGQGYVAYLRERGSERFLLYLPDPYRR